MYLNQKEGRLISPDILVRNPLPCALQREREREMELPLEHQVKLNGLRCSFAVHSLIIIRPESIDFNTVNIHRTVQSVRRYFLIFTCNRGVI